MAAGISIRNRAATQKLSHIDWPIILQKKHPLLELP